MIVIVRSPPESTNVNPRRCGSAGGRLDADAESDELASDAHRARPAERREEPARAGEARELDGGDAAAAGRPRPPLARLDDLARRRHALDAGELDPLDVADHGGAHRGSLTSRRARAFQRMMEAVAAIPPFERFYEERKDEIFGYLARLLGRQAAEDAFQETFLRRSAPTPTSSTVATCGPGPSRSRRGRGRRAPEGDVAEPAEVPVYDERPAYAELEHLSGELPPTERAAVVLRYGYDLSYDDIGAALGSSAEAAAPAASSGVRRLRRKENRMTTVPDHLDRRFRDGRGRGRAARRRLRLHRLSGRHAARRRQRARRVPDLLRS